VGVALDGDTEGTGEAKVGDLKDRVCRIGVVNKQVLGLHVTVHHTVLVAVGDSLQHLVEEAL
jgi:hypothetical protein